MAEIASLPLSGSFEQRRDRPLDGACRGAEGGVFARVAHEPATVARAREEAAKAVCGGCPVRIPCRRHALAARIPYGVRGGLTADERLVLLAAAPHPPA
ncbi:Transcriptional regulator WhiD [Streptomyces sp. enrichment culture]|uniref:WhiB family transcriptional regulator n=1 Tax=Streptomyces toxytricini TaxID=67369 RepID=A0ABW8EFY9_STRT5|nr:MULTISPECIES: WhiB family transcriptional regulator [Streptomyces]GGT23136.1 transcriptional regulator WhiB [Streptomyces toxytricini]